MNLEFFFDGASTPPFGGSFGVLAHFFHQAFQRAGHRVTSRLCPLADKHSPLTSRCRDGTIDARFFYEELFPRYRPPATAPAPSLVFFNLLYLERAERIARATTLLFNSTYLRDCHAWELQSAGLPHPRMGALPIPIPLLAFPDGYPSDGVRLDIDTLAGMLGRARIGHLMRPGKIDYFAVCSLMHHLNQLARESDQPPCYLAIPASEIRSFASTLEQMPLPSTTADCLVPLPPLDNHSMIQLMRFSDFGLCYDQCVEAFGFYPMESVLCGCPIFSNGSGNLRHLLPPDHGISIHEDTSHYWGEPAARMNAYRPTAASILDAVTSGEGRLCTSRGQSYIREHHSLERFDQAVELWLQRSIEEPVNTLRLTPERTRVGLSPYLRVADWRRGRFITDRGRVDVPPGTANLWRQMVDGESAGGMGAQLDRRVLGRIPTDRQSRNEEQVAFR